MTLDLGVLISGTGSNLGAILGAIGDGRLDARVRVVISNKPDAAGLKKAEDAGVPAVAVSHKGFASREAFDGELVRVLREAGAEWVVLAGFMRVVTPILLDAFRDRVVNIHPALLPSFPGVDAHAQALAYGVKVTGCTVHFVDPGVDTGPIILQEAVPILDGDDRASLAARVLEREHALLVKVLSAIAEDRVRIESPGAEGGRRRVSVAPEPRR